MALDRQNGRREPNAPPPPDPDEVRELEERLADARAKVAADLAERKTACGPMEPYPLETGLSIALADEVSELENELTRAQRTRLLSYVNAYAVTRHYGGPEEGGWWYDCGTPLASCVAWTPEQVEAAKEMIHTAFDHEYAPLRHRSSVIGEADLLVVVENHFAVEFPAETPHYE